MTESSVPNWLTTRKEKEDLNNWNKGRKPKKIFKGVDIYKAASVCTGMESHQLELACRLLTRRYKFNYVEAGFVGAMALSLYAVSDCCKTFNHSNQEKIKSYFPKKSSAGHEMSASHKHLFDWAGETEFLSWKNIGSVSDCLLFKNGDGEITAEDLSALAKQISENLKASVKEFELYCEKQ